MHNIRQVEGLGGGVGTCVQVPGPGCGACPRWSVGGVRVGACVRVCVNKKNQPEKEMYFVPLHGAKKLDFLLPVASKGSKK